MSNFIRQGSRKAIINKKKMSEQVEQAMKHDGNNWSLLAVGRDYGQTDEQIFEHFGTFVEGEFGSGWMAATYKGHTVFTKEDVGCCYIKPVGHPDGNGGYEVWDFHINNNNDQIRKDIHGKVQN